jgi:hypothetical protein
MRVGIPIPQWTSKRKLKRDLAVSEINVSKLRRRNSMLLSEVVTSLQRAEDAEGALLDLLGAKDQHPWGWDT